MKYDMIVNIIKLDKNREWRNLKLSTMTAWSRDKTDGQTQDWDDDTVVTELYVVTAGLTNLTDWNQLDTNSWPTVWGYSGGGVGGWLGRGW